MAKYNEGFFPVGKVSPIFFRSWTPQSPKLTLVCVHGAGGNSADFNVLGERLSQNTAAGPVRVIAFDSPGSGDSPANAGVAAFMIQRMAIERLIANTPTPMALLASSGGAVAAFVALYAQRRTPRFGAIPVIFAEPSFGLSEPMRRYVEACRPFFASEFRTLDDARRTWDASPMADVAFDSDEAKVAFIRGRLRVQKTALVPATREMDPRALKVFNLLEGKQPLKNPALVLSGGKSVHQAPYLEDVKRVLPGHATAHFQASGHPLSLTRVEETDAIGQFLSQQTGS
jgi:pimeloyl-ACP methyl ester carboxylesterase